MPRLVVVSNRVAPVHEGAQSVGGLVVGVGEAFRRHGGLWFGWSGNVAEQTSGSPRVIESGPAGYATIDLGRQHYRDYYTGFANSTLWPLLHFRLGLMNHSDQQFIGYRDVNALFAERLLPLLRKDDVIWVHDYHLMLLPAELRRRGVKNRIGFFLHTPLPPSAVLAALPHHAALIEGLVSSDLVGLQTPNDVLAFESYVRDCAGGRVAGSGQIEAFGRTCRVAAYPIGIDTDGFARLAAKAAQSAETGRLARSLGGRCLMLGVDRLDYSKGIPHRLRAFEQLLAGNPALRRQVTLLQVTPPSRSDVDQYKTLRSEVEAISGEINARYAEFDWTPIRFLIRNLPRSTLSGFYRSARVGLVTPLRDGMNLVAKEYVAAQHADDPGVLVLSRFAGAAHELDAAILVNPFHVGEIAAALKRAIEMPIEERQERWQSMMTVLLRNTSESWFDGFVSALRDDGAGRGSTVLPLKVPAQRASNAGPDDRFRRLAI